MKKFLLSITAIISLTIGAKAQAPDFGFEAWSNVPFSTTVKDPNGWASLNALVAVGTAQSVFQETTAPAFGTTSAKIQTVQVIGASIPNPNRPGKNFDTAGVLIIGKIVITPSAGIKYGYTYAQAPTQLSFSSKYTPTTGDSAFVLAYLTKWSGTKRDTIATGKYGTGATTSTYSVTNMNITYKAAFVGVVPDSMQIFISSSIYSHGGAKIGSTFYVDDFVWSDFVGINEVPTINNSVSVFPNPANDQINFSSTVDANMIQITDITGRLISSYKMMNNKLSVQTTDFTPGVYLYTVLNDKKEVNNRGKFEVTK